MSEYSADPILVAVTVALEALELRMAEASSCVSQALTDAVRGHRNRAVGGLLPVSAILPEAAALATAIQVLHRCCDRDLAASPGLFPE